MDTIGFESIYKLEEPIDSNIDGTIIDIETIGEFNKRYYDSRRCSSLKQVIFGCIDTNQIQIFCANGYQNIDELCSITKDLIGKLKRPFYAFNCSFESSVWFHNIGIEIDFDGELQGFKYESKRNAVALLRIPQYNDPFFDDGYKCLKAWESQKFKHAIAHNRACLLKERDILKYRGCTHTEKCSFVKL